MRGVATAVALRALLVLALLLAPLVPGRAFAQEPVSDCDTGDCAPRGAGQRETASDELAQSAARIRQARTDFVLSLRHLLEALPGTYGDEGPALRAATAGMADALRRWDRAIRAYQTPLEKVTGQADVHVALGTVLLERGRAKQAVEEFTAASRLAPDRAAVFLLLGLAFDAVGRHADAAKAFTRAATLPPGNADNAGKAGKAVAAYAGAQQWRQSDRPGAALEGLQAFNRAVEPQLPLAAVPAQQPFPRAGLLRESAGVAPIWPPARYAPGFDALARGSYAEAVAGFDRAVAQDPLVAPLPTGAVAPLAAGVTALRAGQLRAALEHVKAAVAAAPDAAEPRRLLALALRADDRADEAIEQLQQAVRLDPTDERARLALGRTLASAGRSAMAERAFRDTLSAIPMSAHSHFELGRLYDAAGRHREAADAFAAAAARPPIIGEERVHELRGRALIADTDFDGAIQAFTRRVEVSPNYAPAHRALAEAYKQLGRDDEALAELTAAALIEPADALAHAGRAQLHLRSGRYQDAAGAARAALARDGSNLTALYALGSALVRLGRAAEGEEALARFRAGQDAARASDERGWELRLLRQTAAAHLERGELTEAIERLQAAVALQPDAEGYSALGVALTRAGRTSDALDALEQAVARGGGSTVHALMADLLAALGRIDDSRRHLALAERARDERFRDGAPR
jgi:tetratricopeptide (TPR) repeat protein